MWHELGPIEYQEKEVNELELQLADRPSAEAAADVVDLEALELLPVEIDLTGSGCEGTCWFLSSWRTFHAPEAR